MFRRRQTAEQKAANAAAKAAHIATQHECQICERKQCIAKDRTMVLHGYTRPGYGFIQGSCFGVGHLDYTKSTSALVLYLASLKSMLVNAEANLRRYVLGQVTHFETMSAEYAKDEHGHTIYIGRKAQTVPVITSWAPGVSNRDKYEAHLKSKHANASTSVTQLEGEIARVERRIAAWVLVP